MSVSSFRPSVERDEEHHIRTPIASLIAGRRTKYVVIAIWLGLLLLSALFAGKLGDVQKSGAEATLPTDSESTQVLLLQDSFVEVETLPAVIVYERASGLTDADRAKVTSDAQVFGQRPDLEGQVIGPVFSDDGQAAKITVPLALGTDSFSKATDAVDSLTPVTEQNSNGLSAYVTGPAGATADQSRAIAGIDTTLLLATAVVVIIILLLTYRSPTLWLLPIMSAGVALVAAQALIYVLARYADLTVTADGSAILTILVFGAGTDYALLLIARYREELRRHADRHEAMAVALHRSAPALLASAGTVAAGVLCLLLADMNSTKGLGPVFAIGIVVGLAVMLTLFPALLVTAGRWIFWPSRPKFGTADESSSSSWARIGRLVARRPRSTWVLTSLVLAVLSLGIFQLDPTGLTSEESFRGQHDSIVGNQVLGRHFAAGAGSPTVVISNPGQMAQVRDAFAAAEGVDPTSVTEPVVRGDHAYLEGTLIAPADSKAAYDTVDRIRASVHAIPGADAKVGGNTAIKLDVQRAAQSDRNLILPIVFVVVFLILVLLLRSLVAPLILTATVVLSFGAALGVSALVFRHIFGFEGTDSSFPLFVFVFLVSLGVDYNIFLMTRIREEAVRHGTRPATHIGLAATGGVITSAGLVLAGTFAVLATLPLTQFAELGFAVAFGILLDTLIVRSIMVTALNFDIGRYMWWPGKLFHKHDEQVG
ncbi:MMPL family transporter [Micromonospora sp. CA-259024]|uniref:MMPL family transporter n=1 Tax=Micromonospora sp. CA-259024 TaxID=3239965 RepID=UPI003D91BD03